MGLAPYGQRHIPADQKQSKTRFFIHGNLHDGTLDAGRARDFMYPDPDLLYSATQSSLSARERQESFAYQLQSDIEDVILNFIKWLVPYSGASKIVFAGGVALNSCVNSKLNDLPCVSSLYVSPYPGDEGISVGCAAFGNLLLNISGNPQNSTPTVRPFKKFARMPYLGRHYSAKDVKEAVQCFAPWVQWMDCDGAYNVAGAIADGAIVGWFDGPSELGQRALGHRSLLADPRYKSTRVRMNADVKKREPFRPFAPVVLSNFCDDWFCGSANNPSCRFMSMTRSVVPEKRHIIPAVVHVDGSARVQTVCVDDEYDSRDIGEFGKVLTEFHKLTGVPVLMNTSFNVAGEPIVESPFDAIRTLVRTPSITILGFSHGVARRKVWKCTNLDDEISSACVWLRVSTVSDGLANDVQAHVEWAPIHSPHIYDETDDANHGHTSSPRLTERVELVDRLEVSILECVHALRQCTVRLLINRFCDDSDTSKGRESRKYDGIIDIDSDENDVVNNTTEQDVIDRLLDLHSKLLIFTT